MNKVILIGRLTKDIDLRYSTGANQTAVTRFTIAVDRIGKDKGADFIGCVAFGKTAELMDKYVKKGNKVGISGRIQTGSYEKDGARFYTTDVIAQEVEFLTPQAKPEPPADMHEGYTALTEEDEQF